GVAVGSLIMNGRAGHHAKRSAEASERAAEAARDATAAIRAATIVDFAISGRSFQDPGDTSGSRPLPHPFGSMRLDCEVWRTRLAMRGAMMSVPLLGRRKRPSSCIRVMPASFVGPSRFQ